MIKQVIEGEGQQRYRIHIAPFDKHCIQVPHSMLTHTHTRARTGTQVPRWVVDKEKRTVISRRRRLNVYSEICTFLIIKLCHLNEQTPAEVLY